MMRGGAILLLLLLLFPVCGRAQEPLATRYGGGLLIGQAYDPESIGLLILQGIALLDYDRIAWHPAPDPLRLKLEANFGLTLDGRKRGLAALNLLALYYLDGWRQGGWTPYGEAGIGLIYSDFRVEGQGLRFNFNPQLGLGAELQLDHNRVLQLALRLHHVSNGETYRENRGINSALLMLGALF